MLTDIRGVNYAREYITEASDAVIPHVRNCAGSAQGSSRIDHNLLYLIASSDSWLFQRKLLGAILTKRLIIFIYTCFCHSFYFNDIRAATSQLCPPNKLGKGAASLK